MLPASLVVLNSEPVPTLFSVGKISGNKAAKLRASYSRLHDTLKSSQEVEIRLVGEAKNFRAELERQRVKLEKEEQFPEGPDTEVSRMRQQLLKFHNDLREAEEREYQTQYQLECLQEEKAFQEKEYEMQPKPVELESRAKSLKDSCEDLRKEVAQRRQELKSLMEDMAARQKLMLKEQRELDDKKDFIEIHEAELAQLLSVPGQLAKEIERINRKKIEVEKRRAVVEEEFAELSELQRRTEGRSHSLEEERKEVMREVENRRSYLESAEREHSQLQKEQEMNKERETILMGQRGMLDINLGHCLVERKNVQENLACKLREKERQLRSLKKTEMQLKLAYDTLAHTTLLHDKTKAQRDGIPQGEDSLQKRKELQKEVENQKKNLLHQQSLTEVESQLVEQCIEREQELIRESHRRREELHTLGCLTLIKADEREQKSRELLRAQQRYNRIKQEVKGKTLGIQEHKKQNYEIQSRLSVFAKLYDVIKGERNKCVSLIQMASQRTVEIREKFKILENEIEILRTTAINKDRLLAKSRLKHVHSHAIRDSLRNDISKVTWVLHEMRHRREEQKLDIIKLAHMINAQEQRLLHLRKSHDGAVQNRNERGVQLLEREEEMCIFYEKVNLQEVLLRDGNLEVQAIDEELRSLRTVINEERRQIDLNRKLLPQKSTLEAESTMLQIVLSECKDRMMELEKALEDPAEKNRARELDGKDPTPVELVKKIEQLETRLAEREEQLLEKELVYEQVTRLSQRIRGKAENGKLDTLELAKKVNELQSRIKDSTRRMMSIVSELAMRQASAMSLQQEMKEREILMDACQQRLDQGLAPCPDMEEDWMKALRDERRREADRLEKERLAEEEERSQLPSGVYSTAEARPNAYIPQADALPLPKPYGAQAPFKPMQPGANMRHIRKPQPKPIEI
ncbi:coiled-coil domain-containing protein 146 [Aplochiton taeniatus]